MANVSYRVGVAVWPDASNTGVPAGTTLTNTAGRTITTNGVTVQNENISGTLTVNANNVTVQRCQITANGNYAVEVIDGKSGTLIQDCTIVGDGSSGNSHVVRSGGSATALTQILRNNISNTEDGIIVTGSNVLIKDNYLHGFAGAGSPHIDGISCDGEGNDVTIEHNSVQIGFTTNTTAGIAVTNAFGDAHNYTINNNKVFGGTNCLLIDGNFVITAGADIDSVTITNNRLKLPSGGGYALRRGATNVTISGNVDDVSGANVDSSI